MSIDNQNRRAIRNEFIERICIRLLLPFYPIFFECLIGLFLEKDIGFTFPNKSVIIIAMIMPISYLPDFFRNANRRSCLIIALFIELPSTVAFVCYLFEGKIRILWFGLLILSISMIVFLILDYIIYRRNLSDLYERGL